MGSGCKRVGRIYTVGMNLNSLAGGFAACALISMATCRAQAQELHGFGGIMQHTDTDDSSYSWQLEYREGLGEHFAYSISYLNEGHVAGHHRDGHMAQLWTRTNLMDRRLSLAAGIGPFRYFDTTAAKAGASYENDHGWGVTMSLAATWYTADRWLFQLRTNFVETTSSIDTISTLIGIGYQLEAPPTPGPLRSASPRRWKTTENELTVFLGRTIVNSFSSEHSVAAAVEYRRGLWRYVDWTVGWLFEGDNRLSRRNGLTTQLWATRAVLDDRLSLGIGVGPYINVDHYRNPLQTSERTRAISGIVTLTASYRLAPDWALRSSWNRIVTSYNRDTDMILGGVGYRF
ncbi:hypothetical protein JN12_00268 [Geobacter argillaceus]|uniref:Outer membrane protein with beta-barrel domain n=2 Tax=Geobacter argillaceus TaxID=345631 RepID=A0A562WTG2_9BACT|nr:hypothetical protein JN12_00268 [Geobacter argillaceus]